MVRGRFVLDIGESSVSLARRCDAAISGRYGEEHLRRERRAGLARWSADFSRTTLDRGDDIIDHGLDVAGTEDEDQIVVATALEDPRGQIVHRTRQVT